MMRKALVAAVLTALAACSRGGDDTPSTAMRDSAGVRIVENTGLATLSPLGWRVEDPAQIELGGSESPPLMHQVTDACRLGDGRIVVASSGTQQLHLFGPDGRYLESIGRDGDGPGEFRSIFFVGSLPGDSIAAWDPALGRLSVFGPGGEYARAVTPGNALGSPLPRVHGLLPDGRFVVTSVTSGGVPASGESIRDTLEFALFDAAGTKVENLGRFPGTEHIAHVDHTGMLMRPLPFGSTTVATVEGNSVYLGEGDRYEVSVYESGRGLRSRIRGDRERLPVTGKDIDAFRRDLVTIGGPQDARAARRQETLLNTAPYPARMPAFAALEVDSDGNLWVQETRRPGESDQETWTVYAADGIAMGTVQVPKGLRVKQIGPGWILGLALDSEGSEKVRLHRLLKGPADAPQGTAPGVTRTTRRDRP